MLKNFILRICPNFIIKGYLRMFKYPSIIRRTYKHYEKVVEQIRNRGNKPLRFAAYVLYDSTFGGYGLMDLMLSDLQHYSPKIVICPDVARGETHLKEQYKRTKAFFVEKYGAEYVIDGYNEITGQFIDNSGQFDVIYCANPYDSMVNEVHGVQYLSTKNVLPIYINYGYTISKWHYVSVETNIEMSLFYKYYVDSTYTQKQIKKYQLAKGKNTVLVGYAKLDSLIVKHKNKITRLKVLISPHHTIDNQAKTLYLSNFLIYYNLIIELPDLFPDIDFVFRPHPLLFINLINQHKWSKEMVEKYKSKLSEKNIQYSYGGDYLHLFNECDAIIHDCGSFMVEWLYTGKPCCYVVRGEHVRKQLDLLGNKALDYHTLAYNRNDIISFINNLKTNYKISNISSEIKNNIILNHPNVSNTILNNILC